MRQLHTVTIYNCPIVCIYHGDYLLKQARGGSEGYSGVFEKHFIVFCYFVIFFLFFFLNLSYTILCKGGVIVCVSADYD